MYFVVPLPPLSVFAAPPFPRLTSYWDRSTFVQIGHRRVVQPRKSRKMKALLLVVLSGIAVCGTSLELTNPYSVYSHRLSRKGCLVDVGYAKYEGQTTGNITTWLG